MSYLQQVQKISEAHYVLPKIGDMRTEVHAYLSETLFKQTDEALWRQAARTLLYLPRHQSGWATCADRASSRR